MVLLILMDFIETLFIIAKGNIFSFAIFNKGLKFLWSCLMICPFFHLKGWILWEMKSLFEILINFPICETNRI